MENFKPMLAIDATNALDKISYPKLASTKLDGIRCIFHPKLGMVSRSLKPIQNKQLQEKFKPILNLVKEMNIILDGELYGHNLTFQEITRVCMTKDFNDPKTIKKFEKLDTKTSILILLESIKFCCFEVDNSQLDKFSERALFITQIDGRLFEERFKYFEVLNQILVHSKKDVIKTFNYFLKQKYEGAILRALDSPYKYGRSTLKEEYMLKVKPFETFDAPIKNVVQATEVNPNAEKKINELGRSVTSRLKEDRVLIKKACAFEVCYNDFVLKVSLAMTDVEKEEIWQNRDLYLGKMIEYKGMMIGAKDVPRHPVFVRFREDKN